MGSALEEHSREELEILQLEPLSFGDKSEELSQREVWEQLSTLNRNQLPAPEATCPTVLEGPGVKGQD